MFIVLTQENKEAVRGKFICQLQCLPFDLVYVYNRRCYFYSSKTKCVRLMFEWREFLLSSEL